jgi:hypothetical protein
MLRRGLEMMSVQGEAEGGEREYTCELCSDCFSDGLIGRGDDADEAVEFSVGSVGGEVLGF